MLSRGGLVAFATETVYGLGAVATDPAAVARIFEAKGRPAFNPLIVHVEGIDQARTVHCRLAREPRIAWPARFWPGPLTLVLPRSSLIPDIVTGGRETVALRVPAAAVARGLIERVGPAARGPQRQPLEPALADPGRACPGRPGRPDRPDPRQRADAFGLESTVLDLTTSPLRLLRPGPVTAEQIALCLDGLDRVEAPAAEPTASNRPASPGMLPLHYAPATPALARGTYPRVNATETARAIRDRRLRACHPAGNRSGNSPFTPAGTDPRGTRPLFHAPSARRPRSGADRGCHAPRSARVGGDSRSAHAGNHAGQAMNRATVPGKQVISK